MPLPAISDFNPTLVLAVDVEHQPELALVGDVGCDLWTSFCR